MDQHPEYGLSLIKDNYNAFQIDSFNKEECSKLRTDKWKTCHPQNSDLQPCTADMTIDELKALFKQHQSCYHFRVAENQSLCFDKPDPGHIKAEKIELHHVKQCRLLLEAKSISNTKATNESIDSTQKNTVKTKKKKPKQKDHPMTEKQESIEPDDTIKQNDTCSKQSHTYKWWVYLLGIIAIIGIGLFLFYVV